MRQVLGRMLSVVVLGAGIVACGADDTADAPQQSAAAKPSPAPRENATGTVGTNSAADFVRTQLTFGNKQIGLARIASERASSPAVKALGETVVRDHQVSLDSLRQLASTTAGGASPNAEQLEVERARLSKLSGPEFDREYLDELIADHERAVADLEAAAAGQSTDIRQWVTTTLPVLRRHLEEARQLRKSTP